MTVRDIMLRLNRLPCRDTAQARMLRRNISKELLPVDRSDVLALAFDLIPERPWGRFLAYEIVQHHAETTNRLSPAEIEKLGAGICDWAAVDTFACYVSGPAWREGRLTDARIRKWAGSRDLWWRRAALVSTVPLNVRAQGGHGDAPRTLAICQLLLDDREDMVVKALSWALRALAVREPGAVAHFLENHQDRLAPLVKREVTNKLKTGLKTLRRKSN